MDDAEIKKPDDAEDVTSPVVSVSTVEGGDDPSAVKKRENVQEVASPLTSASMMKRPSGMKKHRSSVVRRRSKTSFSTRPSRKFTDSYRESYENALPLTRVNFDQFLGYFRFDPDRKTTTKVSLFKLLSFSSGGERWWMVFGVIMATISGLGLPAWLILLARSLDTFSSLAVLIDTIGGAEVYDYLRQELNKLCVAFVIVGVVALVSGSIYVSIWTCTGEKEALRIQKAFVRSAINQDAAWFDTSHDREALPTEMGTSLVHIRSAIGRQIVDTYASGVSAVGCLAVALILNSSLSLIMLAVLPVVFIIILIMNYFIRRASKQSSAELAQAGSIATEVIAGVKTVAALCAQPWFRTNYEQHIEASERFSIQSTFLSSLLAGIMGFIFYVTFCFAFYIGTEQVISGAAMSTIIKCFISDEPNCRVTGASVMCCIYGVILCVTFVGLMTPGVTSINLGRQAAVDVFDTIHRKPPIDPSSETGKKIEVQEGGRKIEFRKIFFYYPSFPDKPIFFNFNMTIEPGQSVALVGPSGSGKSTIARFLLRFYDPNDGDVLIDGVPLKDLNVAWWRSQVGYVAQEPGLLPGTIRDNIAFGKPVAIGEERKVTDEEIIEAAKMACAHDFIMELPEGYDTFYSGTSLQLSGGQLQRIAIARAIVRNPSVLVLDEATSALDSTSERHVQQALANVRKMKQMTTVTIAHRLSTIIDCEQIAVLSRGSIAELGNHKTLMEQGGIYSLLCKSQGITAGFATAAITQAPTMVGTVEMERILSMDEDRSIAMPAEQPRFEQKVVEEVDPVELKEVEMAAMSKVWTYLGSDAAFTAMGLLGSLIVGALSPCESILTAQIVTTFYTYPPDEMLEANSKWILGFLLFAALSLVGNVLIGIGLSRSGARLSSKMRRIAFTAVLRRSLGWFDEPDNTTGELTTSLGADAEAVAALVGIEMGYRVRVLSSLTTGVIVALVFSVQIGLIAIACVPMILIAGVIQVICLRRKFIAETDTLSPSTILEQGLRGITAVQAYNLESRVGDDYEKALEPESAGKVQRGAVAGLVYGFSQCAIFISFALVFYVGTELLVKVEIGFLEFFTALLAVMFGALGTSQVSADFSSRQEGRAAAARIFSVLDGPEDGSAMEDAGDSSSMCLHGGVSFEQCEFHYPTRPNNPVFYKSEESPDALTLAVPPKESLGLVGRSGSGKSSVLQLVLRFYEVSSGTVLMDEQKLKQVNVTWLRKQIGYVGQQPTLFNGTVRQNILLGKEDATEDELVAAGKAAHAHDFGMQLANGYDTAIGTGGGQLSGGQKQRIAIARAIIRNPKILVLDEATSALDNESEKLVQAALDELQRTQPRTTLVVAHRLLTVKECDKIAFLGDGGVKEIGKHDELLEEKGHYHKLWMMQGAEEELKKQ